MIKVMLADDDIEMLTLLDHLIDWQAHGFAVIGSADDPRQLLALPEAPDLLIADITMPEMDGFTLAETLRARNAAMKLILLTCHDDFAYTQQAIHIRADDYLLKYTLTAQKLLEALERVQKGMHAHSPTTPLVDVYARCNQDVKDVMRYIQVHLAEGISLESAAASVYKNSSYLSRLFKRETGKTFSQYLIDERIARATQLLMETNLSIPEICRQTGIENPHYFYRFYYRETGKKPNEMRKP